MVIAAVQLDCAKKCLYAERTAGIALLHGPSRLLVGKKLRVGKEPLEQPAGVPVHGRPEFFLQPMRAEAKALLACQTLAR
jgi:hypothetical protein